MVWRTNNQAASNAKMTIAIAPSQQIAFSVHQSYANAHIHMHWVLKAILPKILGHWFVTQYSHIGKDSDSQQLCVAVPEGSVARRWTRALRVRLSAPAGANQYQCDSLIPLCLKHAHCWWTSHKYKFFHFLVSRPQDTDMVSCTAASGRKTERTEKILEEFVWACPTQLKDWARFKLDESWTRHSWWSKFISISSRQHRDGSIPALNYSQGLLLHCTWLDCRVSVLICPAQLVSSVGSIAKSIFCRAVQICHESKAGTQGETHKPRVWVWWQPRWEAVYY